MKRKVALLSVYDKEGIVGFAQALRDLGFRILASGGTARALKEAGIPVSDVAKLVGGKAILGHRVVTLSREVHAGLLARYDLDVEEMERLGIPFIDLVCVDMYPLKAAIAKADATTESVIEQTDIGGPTMLRSAAKGRRIVICDQVGRRRVTDWLRAGRPDEEQFITELCATAERTVAEYCLASATFHSGGDIQGLIGTKIVDCCYGENRVQSPAALYALDTDDPLAIHRFIQIGGSPPSYNNFCDIDRLVTTASAAMAAFTRSSIKPFLAIAGKHGNPCGAAYGGDPLVVARKMVDGDRLAIFGGTVLTNFPITDAIADCLMTYRMPRDSRRLLDCIVAPAITSDAVELMRRKRDKCRFFVNPALDSEALAEMSQAPVYRPVRGSFLVQPAYALIPAIDGPEFFWCGRRLTLAEELDLLFAWAIGSTSNSNTITLVKDHMLVGNGVGQQARVYGSELAVTRADGRTQGAVAYSDSFFPEIDGPQVLAEAGVAAILTSSGSVRDNDVIEYCREAKVTLVMGPDALIRGFYRH